ncbi:MAG: glycosyltransferase, partial [Candidatus Latescibacterota bacterium]
MTTIITYLTLGLCGLYILLTALLCIGLFRLAQHTQHARPFVSVIIPAKNEEHNILSCLNALATQTYPAHKIEIILVNDRSTDHTIKKAQLSNLPNLKVISIEQQTHLCPKKNAIHHGILASSGEIILTTDADCRPEQDWISSTTQCFTPSMGMVLGYAPLLSPTQSFPPFLSLQSLVVAALSAGGAGIGFPLTCTGRNLAYRRQAYDAVNGFAGVGHIIGGDDVYLMNKIAQTPYQIAFNLAPRSS